MRPITLLATGLALLVAGCTLSLRPGPPAGIAARCVLVPSAPTAPGGTDSSAPPRGVQVALGAPVDPARAPEPTDEGERMVFRQLYETLVRVDCEGRTHPGLATSWSHDATGRRWSFRLRSDARFWDETPVDARAVARGWISRGVADDDGGRAGSLVDSVRVSGDRGLTVFPRYPSTSVATFAQPGLAVTAPAMFGPWPMGTGPYRPQADPGLPRGDVHLVSGPPEQETGSIIFRVQRRRDERSALDRGADVLVSTDPDVIAYARALPGLTAVPLPWSRTYVVAAMETGGATEASSRVPADALGRLSRGAVRADTRPAEPPFWWEPHACTGGGATRAAATPPDAAPRRGARPSRPQRRTSRARILYPAGDPVARGIAERLVGLAGPGSASPPWLTRAVPGLASTPASPVAAELDAASLPRAMRQSEAMAFVVPMPRAPGGPCVSELLGDGDELAQTVLSPALGLRVTPLLDVRASVLLRRGVTGIALDGDGTLVFTPGELVR